MKMQRKLLLLLSMILALSAIAPAALAFQEFEAEVSADEMRVYTVRSPHTYLGALPKGTVVTVKDYANGIALISYKDHEGVAQAADMKKTGAAQTAEAPKAETSGGKSMIAVRDTRVFSSASTSSAYVTVRAGTSLNLLASNGNCAKVERGGRVGYAVLSHLGEPGSAVQETVETVEETPAATETVQTGRMTVVTNRDTRIYQQASPTGDYVSVSAGTPLTLVAVKGGCAKVEHGSAVGYMYKSHLTNDASAIQAAKDAAEEAARKAEEARQAEEAKRAAEEAARKANSNPFKSGTNQAIIFSFLVSQMGYNKAAALGVVSNVKYESSYNPHDVGDGGTSYGICQWHAGRKTSLISWCANHDYDYTTLEGQLYYLKHDLTSNYPHVNSYLKQVDNSAQGAYDAGYYFCYHFESPASRESRSVTRGNYARELFNS